MRLLSWNLVTDLRGPTLDGPSSMHDLTCLVQWIQTCDVAALQDCPGEIYAFLQTELSEFKWIFPCSEAGTDTCVLGYRHQKGVFVDQLVYGRHYIGGVYHHGKEPPLGIVSFRWSESHFVGRQRQWTTLLNRLEEEWHPQMSVYLCGNTEDRLNRISSLLLPTEFSPVDLQTTWTGWDPESHEPHDYDQIWHRGLQWRTRRILHEVPLIPVRLPNSECPSSHWPLCIQLESTSSCAHHRLIQITLLVMLTCFGFQQHRAKGWEGWEFSGMGLLLRILLFCLVWFMPSFLHHFYFSVWKPTVARLRGFF